MVKLAEYPRTATFSWSHDRVPVLATGTASGAIDADFSSTSTLEFWSLLSFDEAKPKGSIVADARFNDLDWSKDNKIVAGALENGTVEFFDADAMKSVAKISKHQGSVKTLSFNTKQSNVLVSGGSQGDIFVWDTNKIESADYSPFSSGSRTTPIDEVSSLAWNQSLAHVFASASSSGYASIWDLKAKKEVLHLSYSSPTSGIKVPLTVVEWHPSNSTRIATATNLDSEPVILVWDLRNSNVPMKVLANGHSKGVLSLDWCKQDENLLLSSGRDNTSILWNPEEGSLLTQFATRGNWVFKSKFAPEAPDLFASASFDNKIVVQTLQNLNTSLDAQANESKQHASEDEFWNNVTENSVDDKPNTVKIQAPSWYGNRSPAAQWAFGGKLVKITNDQKGVSIVRPSVSGMEKNELFDESLKNKDFVKLINKRLSHKINATNEEDWNLLENLSMDGTEIFLKEALSLDEAEEEQNEKETDQEGSDFFNDLNDKFVPSGSFELDFSESVKPITSALVKGDLRGALSHALEKDLLLEALIIGITSGDETLIDRAKNSYFTKYSQESSLARTLYSTAQKDVTDIVENIATSQWKEAVKLTFTYTKDEEKKNSLLVKLGERLLAEGNRKDAILLYLAGQSLDNIASIWLDEFTELESELKSRKDTLYEAHLECLTEFVERFTVLSDYINKDVKITNQELISKFLEFVNVTATNGDFDLALRFLETLPGDNEEVKGEKQRVLIASGKSVSSRTSNLSDATKSKQGRYSSVSANAPVAGIATPNPLLTGGQPSIASSTNARPRQAAYASYTPAATSTPNPYAPPVAAASNSTANPYAPSAAATNTAAVAANPYAPAVSSIPNNSTPAGNHNTAMNGRTSFTPASGNIPANPYAPRSAATPLQPSSPVSHPPISGARTYSGQTPHLHEKPIDGWNDLPSIQKEKPTRAKAVNTAPIGVVGSQYGTPELPSGPGSLSRIGSNPSFPAPPPPPSNMRRTPKPTPPQVTSPPPPPPATSKKTSSYAPTVAPTQPATTNAPSFPVPSSNPAPNGHSQFVPPPNPYSPSPPIATPTGIVPPKPQVSNLPAPVPKVAAATAPPPMKMKRKSHAVGNASAANELLSAIQSKPSPPSASVPAPPSSTAQISATPVSTATPESIQPAGISEGDRPIVDFFLAELERVTPLIPQEYSKQLKDCNKRIKILIKHLEQHDLLTQPTIDKLHHIVELLKEGKYADALEIHKDLSENHSAEAGNWLTGVKRLINIAEATSSQ